MKLCKILSITMPDYSKSKIYTIRHKTDTSLIYVGSTTQKLYRRYSHHRKLFRKDISPLNKLYNAMKETNIDDWYIQLHEDYPCNSKEELLQKEAEVIREISTLNYQIPLQTTNEWLIKDRKNNPEKYREKDKKWREQNPDKKAENDKEYRETHKEEIKDRKSKQFTCECGRTLRYDDKSRHNKSKIHQEYILKNSTPFS
jgi:hypothetical protein